MQSGFENLRSQMPMDMNSDKPVKKVSDDVARGLKRIVEIWRMCRSKYGVSGPFLFAEFSAADAMYAPVTSRFRTYGIDLSQFGDDGTAAAYCDTILSLDAVRDWTKKGQEQLTQLGRPY
jgi:glutathione S-transferase